MIKQITECTNCGWCGTDDQKKQIPDTLFIGAMVDSCPVCANIEFYVKPQPRTIVKPSLIVSLKHTYQLN